MDVLDQHGNGCTLMRGAGESGNMETQVMFLLCAGGASH